MKEKSKETSPIKLEGLWKDGDASYHFHIPIEYEVVEKGSDSPTSKYSTAFVKIKPIRLLVRKRTTTGSMTLGFTTALNTGTATLGFTGGATITYTDLVEEEF